MRATPDTMPRAARVWSRYLETVGLGPLHRRWRALKGSPGFRFAVRFILWFALLQFAVSFLTLDEGAAQAATAAAVVGSSPLFGLEAARQGDVVTFDGAFSYAIEPGCTAVMVAGMLLASIVAYPTSPRRRLAGIVLCLPFTFLVNLLRLDTMAWLGVHVPGAFQVVHELGWEVGVILIGAAGFAGWVRALEALDGGAGSARRLRGALASIALFLALFAGGMTLVVRLGLEAPFGRALALATTPAGQAFWGSAYPPPDFVVATKPILLLTALVGYASLFLASLGVPLRRRLVATLWGALLPVCVGGFLGTLVVAGSRIGEIGRHPLSIASAAFGYLGVPMLAWVLWSSRLRRERRGLEGGGAGEKVLGRRARRRQGAGP